MALNKHSKSERPVTIANYPRCAAYLRGMRVKLDDPEMTDYWFASILSDGWTDDALTDAGTINFDTMSGAELLTAFEVLLADKKRAAKPAHADMESLKAFLGSRGVKVSKLPDDAAYWYVASVLWPDTIRAGAMGTLSELGAIIRRMPKKARQAARANLRDVPSEWRA